jgi:hypothetical protein
MKLSHWILLAASIMAILTLRLLLYYGMAHGRLDVLLHLYAVQQYDRHREVPFFNLLLDTLAPAILMGILNGRIGYRERSHGGVMAVSALLVIVNVAAHPIYRAFWGPPDFGVAWLLNSYPPTLISFILIWIVSGVFWAGSRKRSNLPVPGM